MKVIGAYSPFVQSACAVLFKSLVFFSTSCQRGDRHSLLGKDMNVDELITTVFFTILTSKFLPSLHFSSLLLSHDRSQSDADRRTETPCQAITADLWTQQWKHCWKPTRSEWRRKQHHVGSQALGRGGLLSTLHRALFLHKHTYNIDTEGKHRCALCIQRDGGAACVTVQEEDTAAAQREGKTNTRRVWLADLRPGTITAVQWANLLLCVSAVTLLLCFPHSVIKFGWSENSWESLVAECKHEVSSLSPLLMRWGRCCLVEKWEVTYLKVLFMGLIYLLFFHLMLLLLFFP